MPAQSLAPSIETDENGQEWLVYEDVPVFDEHTDDDGLTYDRDLLAQIAANNNDRIEDTGDYCPIVEWHTDDKNDPDTDPPLVGMAGPFTVKRFGKKKPRWAIFARFRIKPDKHEVFKQRPRRSVEIWPEERPEQRYFDPIALLGAETPRRDLGLIAYGKPGTPIRYSMPVAASGGNTFVPGDDSEHEAPHRNQKAPSNMLDQESLQQIIEALKPIIQAEVAEQSMGTGPDPTGGDPLADDLANDPSADLAPDMGAMDAGMDDLGDMGDIDGEPDETADLPPAEPGPEDVDDGEEKDDEDKKQYGKKLACKMMEKYGKDIDGAKQYMAAMDESDRDAVDSYMKGCDDESEEKKFYSKCTCGGEEVIRNQRRKDRDGLKAKYAKAIDDLQKERRKYARVQRELAEAKDQITESTKKERYAKREGALRELRSEGFVLDVDDEMQELSAVSDEQFDNRVEQIRIRYQRVPIDQLGNLEAAIAAAPARLTRPNRSEKYAKKAADVAYKNRLDYKTVLDYMVQHNTENYPVS